MNALAQMNANSADRLTAALAYAARGWHVFPVTPNGKEPLTATGHKAATTDLVKIEAWWTATPNANIGLNLEASGLVAIDADTYKPDCAWQALAAAHDVPVTLTQRSARGGTHFLFLAETGARYRTDLGEAIDTKHKGYILLHPSTFEGGVYQFQNDAPIAPAPDWLKRPEKTLAETVGNSTGASGATLAEVEEALRSVSPDCDYGTWLSVLAGLHNEFGNDAITLAEEWSQRAPHRYQEGVVEAKFASFTAGTGYTIRTVFDLARKAGADLAALRHRHFDASAYFEPDNPDNPLATAEPRIAAGDDLPRIIRPSRFVLRDAATIPPRQWLYDRHLIRGFVSLTVAPGGLGKSSLLTSELLAMATGRPLLGVAPPEPLRVWLWNGEDPAEELDRRVTAACKHFAVSAEDFGNRLMIDSGRDLPISIASMTGSGLKIAVPLVESLIAAIRAAEIDVLVVDPFVTTHSIPENETTAMNAVVAQWRRIASATGCAVELVHHVNKAAAMDTDAAGIYGSRGAGALIDGVRSARFLSRMKKEEAGRLGLEAPERYFRVEMGKANLAPVDKAAWRQMIGVPLHNGSGHWPDGDVVGVCTAWVPPEALDGVTDADVQAALSALRTRAEPALADEQANDWAGYVIAKALQLDVGEGLKRDDRNAGQNAARAKVRGLLKQWREDGALVVSKQHCGRRGRAVSFMTAAETPFATDEGIFG